VDKTTAKQEAQRLCPNLHVPETLLVFPTEQVRSEQDLYERLESFVGIDAIAKPSHASGGTVFLRDGVTPKDLRKLFELGTFDYAAIMREMQYWQLPRNVIVEALIPTKGTAAPDDYKFHCIHGEPLLCQVDHARFGSSWSRLFRVPGFEPMDPNDGLTPPAGYTLPDIERLGEMTAAARALATPFDYVRVDLYDGSDGIYFGELTFTAAASLGIAPSAAGCHRETPTHMEYSQTLMNAFRRG
jgi:hypothetical protein